MTAVSQIVELPLGCQHDEFSRRRLRNRRNLAEAEKLALAEIVGRETVVERDERLSLRFPLCPPCVLFPTWARWAGSKTSLAARQPRGLGCC